MYVPVIHTMGDLGSLAEHVSKRGVSDLGEDIWQEHLKIVNGFWDSLELYFSSVDVRGIKIYQDGMIVEGAWGEKIIEEGVKAGSKNYALVSKLLRRGGVLVKTEDFNLVKQERDKLVALTQAKTIIRKLFSAIKYKWVKSRLLNQRDEFIAKRIAETLNPDEKAILFIGASHNVKSRLPKDILVNDVKDIERVKEYHRLLLFGHIDKQRFNEFGRYLTSKVV